MDVIIYPQVWSLLLWVENGTKLLNKGAIMKELNRLEPNTFLEIDVRKTQYLDQDIIEILDDFSFRAKDKNINVVIISERGTVENPESYEEFFKREKHYKPVF